MRDVPRVRCKCGIVCSTHTHAHTPHQALRLLLSDTCTFIIHTHAHWFENASSTNRRKENENILPKKRFLCCFRFVLFLQLRHRHHHSVGRCCRCHRCWCCRYHLGSFSLVMCFSLLSALCCRSFCKFEPNV